EASSRGARHGEPGPRALPAKAEGSMSALVAGCRIRSGFADAVVLGGTRTAPRVHDRRTLWLSDPRTPATRQPYHARAGALAPDERRLAPRLAAIRAAAVRSVTEARAAWSVGGAGLARAILVGGSDHDPLTIGNPHVRAHALEGRLFRSALVEAF